MVTLTRLGLRWSAVAGGAHARLDSLVKLADVTVREKDAEDRMVDRMAADGEQISVHCTNLEADRNPQALRKLLEVLLCFFKYVATAAGKPDSTVGYNGRYGTLGDLAREIKTVKGNKLISWTDSVPVLADFLMPTGTTLQCYSRLFPGAPLAFTADKINAEVIHTVNPSTGRLSKAIMCNRHVVGGCVYETDAQTTRRGGQDDAAPNCFIYFHCLFGDTYGTRRARGTLPNHYVSCEVVGRIDEDTPPDLAAKWTRSILNTAKPNTQIEPER